MIKFENTEVMNFKSALRGMRNPMNSWDKGDSLFCDDYKDFYDCVHCPKSQINCHIEHNICLGENDLKLMRQLIKAGNEHRKFLRQIFVSTDITAPLYWWKEFDTYKVGTVANSCSTMHKIHAKEFIMDDFSYEHLDEVNRSLLQIVIDILNYERKKYLETKYKGNWWQMIQLLPSSYNQKRTVTLNYEVLLSIYKQREHHKLDEWRNGFVEWIESLPYTKELIININNK